MPKQPQAASPARRKFRLLAGMHEQADRSRPLLDAEGNPVPGRFERQLFRTGDVVETDKDLVALFGPQKFEALGGQAASDAAKIAELEAEIARLRASQQAAQQAAGGFVTPGDPTPKNLIGSPAVAPGGQVSTGFQGPAPEGARKAAAAGEGKEEADDGLDALTVAELRAQAEEDEIDLKGAHNKAEIIARMRGQTKP